MRNKIVLPINEIIYLYSVEGYSAVDLSKNYNCSNCTIGSILRKYHIPIRNNTSKKHNPNSSHKMILSQKQVSEIIKLYTIDHLASTAIGKIFNISFTTVIGILRKHNIPISDSRHDKTCWKTRILISELPSIISSPRYINRKITGLVTCPNCGITRRLYHLTRPRIKDITSSNGKCNSCVMKSRKIILDSEMVKKLYNGGEFTTKEIANKLNISKHTFYKFMKDNGLHIRTKGETHQLVHQAIIDKYNKGTLEKPEIGYKCRGTDIGLNDIGFYKWVECPICLKQRWQHTSHSRKSTICKVCAVDPTVNNKGTIEFPAIGDIRKGCDIGKRGKYYKWVVCPECNGMRWESKGHAKNLHLCKDCGHRNGGLKIRGENSPSWFGGISFEPYGIAFNNDLRKRIRQRDNYVCQVCGNHSPLRKIPVHHIDYNKQHNIDNNLITLCPSCHTKTHTPHTPYTHAV